MHWTRYRELTEEHKKAAEKKSTDGGDKKSAEKPEKK